MNRHILNIEDILKSSPVESIIASTSEGKRLLIRTPMDACISSEYVVQQRINNDYVDIRTTWSLQQAVDTYNSIECGAVC